MAWFSSKNTNTTSAEMERAAAAAPPATTEQLASYSPGQKILMQDTKPRFDPEGGANGKGEAPAPREMMRAAVSNLTWSDFSFAKLSEVPCFRDAGLVGFSAMFIMGSVTLLYHKNPLKAANWATGGLLLGSVVGWEQCRLKRKRSMEMSQAAMQAMQKRDKNKNPAAAGDGKPKSRKEISPEKQKEIDILKREWEIHTNDAAKLQEQNKPWYKVW